MVLLPQFAEQIIPFAKLGRELGVDYAVIKHCSDDETGSLGVDYSQYFKLVDILKEADFIFINELKKLNLYNKIWQAYAALLPLKTVGVMGDKRTYEYTCLLRAVTSEDGMTADFFSFDKDFFQKVSNKIINSVNGINRVVYDITSKPPSTIELE